MANLQIFAFEGTDEIRTLLINDETYFVANDIARSLGYKNPSDATNKYCKRSTKTWGSDSLGRQQEFKVIPESDMYRLIIKSNLPEAVCSSVTSNKLSFLIRRCMVELGSFIIA